MSDFFNDLHSSAQTDKNKNFKFITPSVNPWGANAKSFIQDDNLFVSNNVNGLKKDITFINSGSNEKNTKDSDALINNEPTIEVNKLIKNVIVYLQSEEYVDGEVSKTHLYLEMLHYKYPIVFREIFQKIWLQMFRQSSHNLRNFICISSGLEYGWLEDCADALILSAFSHMDDAVHEAAIRAIESWDRAEHADLISNTRPLNDQYLEQYRQSVLASLRS